MSTPHPPNPRYTFKPNTAHIPLEQRPADLHFTLPDLTPARVVENESFDRIEVYAGKPEESVAVFKRTGDQARTSLHGVVQDERATSEFIWDFELTKDGAEVDIRAAYIAIYAFWLRRDPYERLPVRAKSQGLLHYLTYTGLGFTPPDAATPDQLLIDRSTFYQGAGAPEGLFWLQSPWIKPTQFNVPLANTTFPLTLSFTRNDRVITTHPLRPPKPAPGTVVYSRFIPAIGQHLTLTHIDVDNPEHFAAYSRWQNSDRVNLGWRERGDDDHHRRYLLSQLDDPHTISFVFAWDGELAGYSEASWSKEDSAAAYVGGRGNFDSGTHFLIGEERFRGKHRFATVITSVKHLCFLRDPRTDIVIGEPRYDLNIIPLLQEYLPQNILKEVELPHKRARFSELSRERFFLEGQFY